MLLLETLWKAMPVAPSWIVKSWKTMSLARTEKAMTPAAGCTVVVPMPAPVNVRVLVRAMVPATAWAPAPS